MRESPQTSSSSEQEQWVLFCYKIFYLAQSTAFIVPILYIFLQEKLFIGFVEILQLSALYIFLPILLQLPCGMVADRLGNKINLYISLTLQFLSCLPFLFINNVLAYHLYLICINLAQAFLVGSGIVLLRKQFMEKDEAKFQEYIFNIQNSFYKITSIIILVSAFLYTLNAKIPFLLQCFSFLISIYFLRHIPERYISKDRSNIKISTLSNDVLTSLKFCVKDHSYLFLVLCGAFFAIGVSINQKSIQPQLTSLFDNFPILQTGLVIAVGNLFSSYGSKWFKNTILTKTKTATSLLILGILSVFSFLFMSEQSLSMVIIGFMVINLFKGCYRPILSAELVLQYPFVGSMCTNHAVISIITTTLTAILQFSMAFMFLNIEHGNLVFAILTILVVGGGYLYSLFPSHWEIRHHRNLITGKTGILQKNGKRFIYQQVYPSDTPFEHLQYIAEAAQQSHFQSVPMKPFQNSRGEKVLLMDFLGDLRLSDVTDAEEQFTLCQKIVERTPPIKDQFPPAKIAQDYHIFRPELRIALNSEKQLVRQCLLHGDLNPDNIMIRGNQLHIIDWDLCGSGPYWFDLLSLLSHPHLRFDKNKRLELFSKHCHFLNVLQTEAIFYSFCRYKMKQLSQLGLRDTKFIKLAKQFDTLSLNFKSNY